MLAARFADWREAFADPVTLWLVAGAAAALALAAAVIAILGATPAIGPALRRELWLRLASWAALVPAIVAPVLLGPGWTIAAVALLGLACFNEYARATGLFREHALCLLVVAGILATNFAALDHWYALFVALVPLTVGAIAIAAMLPDRPHGYIQRSALATVGFLLFGGGLAHLGYMANEPGYRPIVLMVVFAVALNDVFAFTVGKLAGGPKLFAATSPNKTLSGHLGAAALTTACVWPLAATIFAGSELDDPPLLAALGLTIALLGQAGDLMLSAIKRDIGIKDMGAVIPGHGGVLDRFNSLLLVAPAVFHFVGYFLGFGLDQPIRIVTG